MLDRAEPAVLDTLDWMSDKQMRARHIVSTQTKKVACPCLRQTIIMSLVLKPILKLLSRPVVCAPLKVLETNIYLFLLSIAEVYDKVGV